MTMALMDFGVWSLVAQQLTSHVVGLLVLWRASPWRPRMTFSVPHLSELYAFSRSVIGINLMNFASRKADDLIIGIFLGPVVLGFYSVAYQLALSLELLFTQGLDAVALSTFSRLQGAKERIQQAFLTATGLASAVTMPVFAAVAVSAPELVQVVLGPQWQASADVVRILAVVAFLHCVFHFNHVLLKACGRPDLSLRLSILNTVVNVGVFLVAVHWGIVAVAAAYAVRAYALAPIGLIMIRQVAGIDLKAYFAVHVQPLIGTILMVAAMESVRQGLAGEGSAGQLLAAMLASGALVYGAWAGWRMRGDVRRVYELVRATRRQVITSAA